MKKANLFLVTAILVIFAAPSMAWTNTNSGTASATSAATGGSVSGGATVSTAAASSVPAMFTPYSGTSGAQSGAAFMFNGQDVGSGAANTVATTTSTNGLLNAASSANSYGSANANVLMGSTGAATTGGSQAMVLGPVVAGNPTGANSWSTQNQTVTNTGLVSFSTSNGTSAANANVAMTLPVFHF